MKETNSEMWFGTKNVLQNNSMVFEMRSQKWRLMVPLIIIVLVIGSLVYSGLSENPGAYQQIAENKEEILLQIKGVVAEVPKEVAIGEVIFILFLILAISSTFLRKAYIRIDPSQLIVKNTIDQWLGRHGDSYIIASPATLTGEMKGTGKSKRAELVISTAGGEVKKIKLGVQVFGNKPLLALVEWLKQNRAKDVERGEIKKPWTAQLGKK